MLPTAQTLLNLNEVVNRVFGSSQYYTDYRLNREQLEVTVYYRYKGKGVRADFCLPAISMSYEQIAPHARDAWQFTREWVEENHVLYGITPESKSTNHVDNTLEAKNV